MIIGSSTTKDKNANKLLEENGESGSTQEEYFFL